MTMIISVFSMSSYFLSSSLLLSKLYLLLRLPISRSLLSGSGVKFPEMISDEAELVSGCFWLLLLARSGWETKRGGREEKLSRLYSGEMLAISQWRNVLVVVI